MSFRNLEETVRLAGTFQRQQCHNAGHPKKKCQGRIDDLIHIVRFITRPKAGYEIYDRGAESKVKNPEILDESERQSPDPVALGTQFANDIGSQEETREEICCNA